MQGLGSSCPLLGKFKVADPDPGSGMGKKSRSGSGMNIPDHITERIEKIFGLEILKVFDLDSDPGSGIYLF
jgi:hypothetical protein